MVDRTRKNLKGEKDTILEIEDAVKAKEGNLPEVRDQKGKFIKGKSGNPSGRPRKKETFNRKVVIERCVEKGCDPIAILAMFANGDAMGLDAPYLRDRQGNLILDEHGLPIRDQVPLKYRLDAAKDLVSYMVPKLRSVEVRNDNDDAKEEVVQVGVIRLPSNMRDPQGITKVEADNIEQGVKMLDNSSVEEQIYDDED